MGLREEFIRFPGEIPRTVQPAGFSDSGAASSVILRVLRRLEEMTMETPKEIYEKFIEFEERAASVYLNFASHFSKNPDLSSFWLEMGMQEKQHAGLLQFCLAEKMLAGDLPNNVTIQKVGEKFRDAETRAADPQLSVDDAFQIALELEASEVNDIYCHLTTTTHSSVYLWHRKVATLAPDHIGHLADTARKFGVGADLLRKLDHLKEKCP